MSSRIIPKFGVEGLESRILLSAVPMDGSGIFEDIDEPLHQVLVLENQSVEEQSNEQSDLFGPTSDLDFIPAPQTQVLPHLNPQVSGPTDGDLAMSVSGNQNWQGLAGNTQL